MGRGIAALVLPLTVLLATLVVPRPAAADDDAAAWARAALADQYELGSGLPLRNTPWVGTHNSFNSSAEMGATLSAQDSNQRIAIVDQLDAGVRSIELDVHWFPSASAGGGFAPVVCHATGEHLGCSVEKPLGAVLDEIAGWLREHRDQVILLYLEDHLNGAAGYDAAATVVESKLGDVLHRPPAGAAGACAPLDLDVPRAAVRRDGDQVIVVSGCGPGPGWRAVAFDWSRTHEEERPRAYQDFPGCGPDFTRADYDTKLIRYFEDSTRVTAGASNAGAATLDDGITVDTAGRMSRCGVDLLGLDQVERDDPRFAALVWSWAPSEPRRRPGCAAEHAARWYSLRCTRRVRVACRTADGRWRVPRRPVRFDRAGALCRRAEARFAVPRTGYDAQRLRVAMERVDAGRAWVRRRVR
jgi:hypothetical protein